MAGQLAAVLGAGEQERPAEDAGDHEGQMCGADDHAHQVGYDEAHERDDAGERDGRADEEGDGHDHDDA